ncbi:MAG TPA: methyltransferase domain-containing protein, partial [Thermoanaerobaculia bacterium]|nr:methyltransferase domain-containing protein [Thermoanaerobaculia bacterium]
SQALEERRERGARSCYAALPSRPTASEGKQASTTEDPIPEEAAQIPMPRTTEDLPAQDPLLRFLHDTLGLEHLHYGLWDRDDRELTFTALRRAQERYAHRLLEVIATLPVADVLDVGCGFGTNASLLAHHGYRVALLSPDPYQLARIENGFMAKHLTRFEEFVPSDYCDLVLMSESSQYVRDLDRLFAVAASALRQPGYLLIADYFTRRPRGERRHPIERSGHAIDELRTKARAAGFELQLDEDISEAVLPTLELAARLVDQHLTRTLRDLDTDFSAKCGRTRPLSRWMRRQLKYRSLCMAIHWVERRVASDFRPRIDPDAFRRLKEYRILLFQRGP